MSSSEKMPEIRNLDLSPAFHPGTPIWQAFEEIRRWHDECAIALAWTKELFRVRAMLQGLRNRVRWRRSGGR